MSCILRRLVSFSGFLALFRHLLAKDLGDQFLDLRDAAAAGAARLGEMGHLLGRVELVGGDHLLQKPVGQAEAFADDLPLLLRMLMVVDGDLMRRGTWRWPLPGPPAP